MGTYRIVGRGASEIAADVEDAVARGSLQPGDQLPAMRALAGQLGVNPNTVAAAYRTLRERGVITTDGRRGSRVRSRPVTTPRESIGVDISPGVRDLAGGNPDPRLLPPLAPVLAALGTPGVPVMYGAAGVEEHLRAAATAELAADHVPDGPLAVTSGALDAVERVLAARLRPGDAVAVEDPGWGSLLDLLSALNLRTLPVALDDDGPLPDAVAAALRAGARALVVTARAQNPTGAAVGEARARDLRAVLAHHRDVLLIEDDHGHGIVDLPLYPIAGATDHWAFVRSGAKALGPDLRVAHLTGDPTTVDRVAGRQRLGPGWVSHLLQRAVAQLSGARTGAAASYRARRAALVTEIAARGVRAHGRSGLNVWVPVGDETGTVSRLLAAGYAVAPGARFRIDSAPAVRITVSGLSVAEVPEVAEAVAAACRLPPAHRRG
ncbi:aminotransferase class I/II-fold pyridoxal phosphate-dependent enzyme [Streptomyces bohaiensis]|uniref:Aminotransferase class I/II-fold pyridoxal phosphate-dependent enzyme n=1 Tax=Streptomyces bohaiensis TaxID=1431344 RepID=A0ABX1C9W6_9ACTN|nr:aminotransferase class I/II-fold pyridoxal phosphate-dependent enzyme [Streptomyces bohaiensis]NJQ15931.1 aminotransferase class I/II-fold pyridoxal phosphate-dependent enzyme [Streptomyces bohaiensis]